MGRFSRANVKSPYRFFLFKYLLTQDQKGGVDDCLSSGRSPRRSEEKRSRDLPPPPYLRVCMTAPPPPPASLLSQGVDPPMLSNKEN